MPWTASRLPAAIITKRQGTGSVLTIAPHERSDWPVIGNSPSWSAVSRFCWECGVRVLISSMKRTPPCARWIAPDSTRSWAGVSRPPRLERVVPDVAEERPCLGARGVHERRDGRGVVVTSSFGTSASSFGVEYRSAMKTKAAAMIPISHWNEMNEYPMIPIRSSIRSVFLNWIFFLASALWAATICLPLPAGTVRTIGLFESSPFG